MLAQYRQRFGDLNSQPQQNFQATQRDFQQQTFQQPAENQVQQPPQKFFSAEDAKQIDDAIKRTLSARNLSENPIFSGKLGIYDGVIVHQCNRVINTPTGNGGIPVGHALFLGAQAGVFALGGRRKFLSLFILGR